MLKKRILSSLILLAVFLFTFFLKSPILFLLVILSTGSIVLSELSKLLKLSNLPLLFYWIVSILPIIFFYSILFGINFSSKVNQVFLTSILQNFALIMSIIGSLFWLIIVPIDILYKKISTNLKFKILYGYLMVAPLIVVASFIFITNKFFILILFFMISFSDVGAYFFGKAFGKNKLARTISPGKTIEGAVGGVLSNLIFIFILSEFYKIDLILLACFATIVTILSIYGDIYQSFLKRQIKVKDSGSIIPGHGGFFDRLDGFCSTIPIAYLLITVSTIYSLGFSI